MFNPGEDFFRRRDGPTASHTYTHPGASEGAQVKPPTSPHTPFGSIVR